MVTMFEPTFYLLDVVFAANCIRVRSRLGTSRALISEQLSRETL